MGTDGRTKQLLRFAWDDRVTLARVVTVATEDVRIPVARARVERLGAAVLRAEGIRDAQVSITFVTSRRMAALNWTHLGHRGPTDVISFEFSGPGTTGDIYIAPDVARENARAHGCGVREELLRLCVHGVLHILGHDHPTDESRAKSTMWKRQEQLLARAMTSA
ncbi:MAG: metalloprotease ybeY [Gemmatimonadetes bacterium]|nr:metalloprotease ybeY [Gemmatimonadota bacterium]